MDLALMFFGLCWWLLGGKGAGPTAPAAPAPPPQPSNVVLPPVYMPAGGAPPWPQVVPAGLPPFPGSGWEFDEPPPAAVQQRAGQLLNQLWQQGSGAFKVEQTSGRWIAYRAEIVRSGKKGVVAYRLRSERPQILRPAQPAAQPAPAAALPGHTASRAPAKPKPKPKTTPPRAPSSSVPPQAVPQRKPEPVSMPTPQITLPILRRGAGIRPLPPDPNVRLLQQKLGIKEDGQFGSGTEAAVIAFQRRAGFTGKDVDGVVGPKTWTALFAVRT